MNSAFYDQLGGVAGVFDQWGACERTVVACALARKVPWPGLRLLQRTVDAALTLHSDDKRLERDANDETLLAGLLAGMDDDEEEEGERLRQLITLLPFLRTDNEKAKDVYVSSCPSLIQRVVDAPRRLSPDTELCRQLLSYLLVHPALTYNDQRTLTQWLRYLENHISGNRTAESIWQQKIEPGLLSENNIWGTTNTFRRTIGKNVEFRGLDPLENNYTTDLLQESFSKNGRDVELNLEGEKLSFDAAISQPKSQRSNSLTPPSTNFIQMSSSSENLSDEPFVQKPRSFSLSSEHSLSQIRPISIMYGTTGSETRLDDLRSNNIPEHPGMSTVAQWLKSLRLHKYVWLFSNITYEQMMAIDDKYLEKLGVTKGARHKILVSIKKLNERESVLTSIQSELANIGSGANGAHGSVVRALERLRGVLLAPMPPESNAPAGIVAALQLASKCISGMSQAPRAAPAQLQVDDDPAPPVDPLSLHCWLVERALHHSCFMSPSLQEPLKRLRHRLPPRQFFHHVCDMPLARRTLKPKWRTNYQPGPCPGLARRWSRPGPGAPAAPGAPPAAPGPPGPPPARPKAHSYPPGRGPPPPRVTQEDYSSLDALCLQMTEQAIN